MMQILHLGAIHLNRNRPEPIENTENAHLELHLGNGLLLLYMYTNILKCSL
jgi:hypothetical protein